MSLRWKYLIPHFRGTEEREMQEELTALSFAENAGKVMESIVAVSGTTVRRIDSGGGPERGQVQLVSGSFFEALGVATQIGRSITPEDDRRSDPAAVVVLSHAYWQRAYGSGPVVGRTIRVEKASFTIIGVAPADFFGVSGGEVRDVWLPLTASPAYFRARVGSMPRTTTS
jgi:hypothetical protein